MEEYKESIKSKQELKRQLEKLEEKILEMASLESQKIYKDIHDSIKDIFGGFGAAFGIINVNTGEEYHESNPKTLHFIFNFADYLLNKYKIEFGNKINKNFRRYIEVCFQYDIVTQKFVVRIFHSGFHATGLIKDSIVRKSTIELLSSLNNIFSLTEYSFDELDAKLRIFKERIDSYDAYIVANKLISN